MKSKVHFSECMSFSLVRSDGWESLVIGVDDRVLPQEPPTTHMRCPICFDTPTFLVVSCWPFRTDTVVKGSPGSHSCAKLISKRVRFGIIEVHLLIAAPLMGCEPSPSVKLGQGSKLNAAFMWSSHGSVGQ